VPYIANARQPVPARTPFTYNHRIPSVYFFQSGGGGGYVPVLVDGPGGNDAL